MILVAVFIFLSLLSVIRPKSNKVFVCLVILTWFVAACRLCYLLHQIYELREIKLVDRSRLYMDYDFVP